MGQHRISGFSLIELMVTIAIVAILLAVAFPSFEATMRSNRIATASNQLLASLSLTRMEAIRSPGGAAICTSTSGTACNGTSWNDGWMVWIDQNGNGAFDPPSTPALATDDRIVRYEEGVGKVDIQVEAGGSGGATEENLIRFDRRGRLIGDTRTVAVEPEACSSGSMLRRVIALNASGQGRMAKETCS